LPVATSFCCSAHLQLLSQEVLPLKLCHLRFDLLPDLALQFELEKLALQQLQDFGEALLEVTGR
jgi:hypothetical protein